jgi:hypothetical protein
MDLSLKTKSTEDHIEQMVLHVTNVSDSTSDTHVFQTLFEYGKSIWLRKVELVWMGTRCYLIAFRDEKDGEKAMSEMNGMRVNGKNWKITKTQLLDSYNQGSFEATNLSSKATSALTSKATLAPSSLAAHASSSMTTHPASPHATDAPSSKAAQASSSKATAPSFKSTASSSMTAHAPSPHVTDAPSSKAAQASSSNATHARSSQVPHTPLTHSTEDGAAVPEASSANDKNDEYILNNLKF